MDKYSAIILSTLMTTSTALHCLVVRPGYGLVSEKCPRESTACRIRISKDAIDFYEYSALYDRNYFVCVHKAEFDGTQNSGCVKKKSGKVRCWCHGRSNCNTPVDSKKLYEAFISEDKNYFNNVIEEMDSAAEVFDYADARKATTARHHPRTTTKPPEIYKVPILSKNRQGSVWDSDKKSSSSGGVLMGEGVKSGFVRNANSKKLNSTSNSDNSNGFEGGHTFSKSSDVINPEDEKHKLRHHHHRTQKPREHKETPKSEIKNNKKVYTMRINSDNDDQNLVKPTIRAALNPPPASQQPKVVLTEDNEVHVIHVASNDRYDRIVDSKEFDDIIQKILPTESPPPSDDLYDEETLQKLDAELLEQQRSQNRPKPQDKPDVVRVLPQEDDDGTFDETDQIAGEYFDSNLVTSGSPPSAFSIFSIITTSILLILA